MFKINRIGLGMVVALGVLMAAPVTADQATQSALANIDKASATLTSMQHLFEQISQRQAELAKSGGEVAVSDAPYKCPACGMMMPTKPSKNLTRAVKYGGKTYYCCAGCDMSSTADKE